MHLTVKERPDVLSIGKCQNLGYYEREVIDGREDYLSEAGTAPGSWVGSLAAADGLTGPADREALAAAFAGQHPHGGRLTEHGTTVTGFDLTLSPSKSVSLLWALGSDRDAAAVEAALYAARDQVEVYLEQTACAVRRGHAGADTEAGRGFLGAVFRHRTSRLGDPGIHLHWVVFNVTEGPDGRRTALDARLLYQHRYTAEAIFQAVLRRELTMRLGVVFDEIDRHGVAEIAGISPAMRRAFSRRRAEIVEEMDRRGTHSGRAARVAALTTRKPKPKGVSEVELRREWRARALDARFDLSQVVRVPRTPTLRVSDDEIALAVTTEHASYDRAEVIRAVARAARQGATVTDILGRTDTYLSGEQAIPLGEGRWTTPEILDLEARVIALAQQPPNSQLTAEPNAVSAAVRDRPSLTGEQQRMVEQLCGSGRRIDVVVGHAGTGKTFALDAVRDAYESSGRRVIGAALAARAARELSAGSGIPASTAHALHAALTTGRVALGPGDVLVVDEAAMVGTRLLAALATETARAEAKLILVGDPKQLPAVEAGGLFTALANRLPKVELVDNRRQIDPDERLVAAALRHGHAAFAVRRLDQAGRVTVATNSDALRDQLVTDWLTHRDSGADVVMGAVHRADVADLNMRAHNALEAAGQLGPLVAVVDDRRFCVGEQVLAQRNRYDLGLVNGDLGEITGIVADRPALRVRIADRDVEVPMDYVTDHLTHAYARTVHKTQGLTCDVALLLGDDTLYTELGYTGLTRGRSQNRLYAVTSSLDLGDDGTHDLAHVIAALETSRAKTAALDLADAPAIA
jgi:conjugative relaxase-like TrwC/TraI family protein